MISKHKGFVLKYAGDAVIGYFPKDPDVEKACENAVNCAFDMKRMIEESVNAILFQSRYPKIRTRITVDAGIKPNYCFRVRTRSSRSCGKQSRQK